MTDRANELLGEALTLSNEERANIAAELMASLDAPGDAAAARAWLEEIERRARAALSGDDPGEDWDQVVSDMRRELKKK